jgi:hypothetical protein
MGAALGLTRTDHTSGELRALSSKCPDSAQVRRLLALALVIDGRPRGEAAALAGMDRQPCATVCIATTHPASKASNPAARPDGCPR